MKLFTLIAIALLAQKSPAMLRPTPLRSIPCQRARVLKPAAPRLRAQRDAAEREVHTLRQQVHDLKQQLQERTQYQPLKPRAQR